LSDCPQPSISRLENLHGATALKRMTAAMVELFCDSFDQISRRIHALDALAVQLIERGAEALQDGVGGHGRGHDTFSTRDMCNSTIQLIIRKTPWHPGASSG
jgi:hypothetical protein